MSRTFIAGIVAASMTITGFSAAPARADDDVARVLAGLTTLFIIGKIISDNESDKDKKKVVVKKPQPKVVYVHPQPKTKVIHVHPKPKKKVVYVHPKPKTKVIHVQPKAKKKVVHVQPRPKVVHRHVERRTVTNDEQRRRQERERHMPRRYDGHNH